MGTDIHQLNIIWNKDKKAYSFEGESFPYERFANTFEYATLPELIPHRSYLLFGIIAGVKSIEYQIENANFGYPKQLGTIAEIEKKFGEYYQEIHTSTWYFLPDLKKELLATAKKICNDTRRLTRKFGGKSFVDEDSMDYYVIEDNDYMMNSCIQMANTIEMTNKKLSPEEFEKSIVLFTFDS